MSATTTPTEATMHDTTTTLRRILASRDGGEPVAYRRVAGALDYIAVVFTRRGSWCSAIVNEATGYRHTDTIEGPVSTMTPARVASTLERLLTA